MRTLLIPIAIAALLGACSKTPQPMVEAVKPMQESMDKAKGVEQTLQNSAESRDQKVGKE